jgi:agmatinase
MWSKNIESFLGCDEDYEQAGIVLFGAPFDGTTSYRPGTRFGCSAMRQESFGLESYSPYQDKDLADGGVFDAGDLELCFGDTERALGEIEACVQKILGDGKLPFLLGGEHLVTLGTFRGVVQKFSDVSILHFDAHADLRDEYLGVSLSHACVMRRCWELIGDGRIFQYGIRSGDREEFCWGKEHVETRCFDLGGLSERIEALKGKPVYVTVDLDVLDPSVFPGTGTPEPGGVSFEELRVAVTAVCSGLNVVGCDVNELSPHYDMSGVSTAVGCKIVREMLLALR